MNKTDIEKAVLDFFKVMVVEPTARTGRVNLGMIKKGVVTDFGMTTAQRFILEDHFEPLPVNTLFTRKERGNANVQDLLIKQFMHYYEVYGLGQPGLFNLEVNSGEIITMNFVKGVTVEELADMVRKLIYSNAPIRDALVMRDIIDEYGIDFNINLVANNEMKVILFDRQNIPFDDGDDAVRYICYQATGNSLLIKSPEVIEAVQNYRAADNYPFKQFDSNFFEQHEDALSRVFNRHKKIILACKNHENRTVINRITRKSKKNHLPVHEGVNKRFVTLALENKIGPEVLDRIGVRDHFKYLDLLTYKRKRSRVDAFVIRNGKIHFEDNRKVWDRIDIDRVEAWILKSLDSKLGHLKDQTILLPKEIFYGLPTSRKQTLGQLPFGTRVHLDNVDRISAGIHWHNNGGAHDLDLSTIDTNGERTGWNTMCGYDRNNPIAFSGDITSAPNGAMEFMTSRGVDYGLFVNIFSGNVGCELDLVVGRDSDQNWIRDTVIKEKFNLDSRNMVLGFVQDRDFVVYAGRLGNNRVSRSGPHPMVTRGMCEHWSVNRLFQILGIDFDVDNPENNVYDHDLSYDSFSYDKLENLLLDE